MTKIIKKLEIKNPQGLHARPAAQFVKTANRFNSRILIKKDEQIADAKSIMSILTLAAEEGSWVELIIEGEDASSALEELERILSSRE